LTKNVEFDIIRHEEQFHYRHEDDRGKKGQGKVIRGDLQVAKGEGACELFPFSY
jgi:hypothetical protein